MQHGLALDAAGIKYEIRKDSSECTIVVPIAYAAHARAEIKAYAQENGVWPVATANVSRQGSGWVGVLGYAAVLVLITILQQKDFFARDWFGAGRMHAGLLRHGELWRAVTALSLHVDLAHLVANVVIGGLIGLFVGELMGSGLAWTSILIAGAVGNLLSGFVRQADYTAVGASTAVFAALGIMAAFSWIRRRHIRASMLSRYAPLVGAVVLLSYLGTGGERTDVLAHVTGFVSGMLLGAVYGKLGDRIVFGNTGQILFGAGAVASVAMMWMLALTRQSQS